MTKKPKWMKKLAAKDLRHIVEGSSTGRATLRSLKANLDGQASSGIDCLECRVIACKLGIAL